MDNEPALKSAATTPSAEPVKRDANAAKALPGLFETLAKARDMLTRAKADVSQINTHSLNVSIGGEGLQHVVVNKKAFADLLIADLTETEAAIAARIKGLGFEPG